MLGVSLEDLVLELIVPTCRSTMAIHGYQCGLGDIARHCRIQTSSEELIHPSCHFISCLEISAFWMQSVQKVSDLFRSHISENPCSDYSVRQLLVGLNLALYLSAILLIFSNCYLFWCALNFSSSIYCVTYPWL